MHPQGRFTGEDGAKDLTRKQLLDGCAALLVAANEALAVLYSAPGQEQDGAEQGEQEHDQALQLQVVACGPCQIWVHVHENATLNVGCMWCTFD